MHRFQKVKGLESLVAEGQVVRARDETIVIADVRLRKGVYTLKKRRAVYKHAGNHARACSSASRPRTAGDALGATTASPRTSS